MARTMIRVDGRPFSVKVSTRQNNTGYHCYFHEKHEWLGRTWGYRSSNKNFGRGLERDEVYDWFKDMAEANLPEEEDGEEVLREVVAQLTDEFDGIEQD